MNLLDVVLLLVLLYSAFRGYQQGALSQVLAFGGAAAGLVIGSVAAPALASQFIAEPGAALALVTLGLLLVFIFGAQGIGFVIGLRLRAAAHAKGAGPVDRTAGVAVGAAGVVFTVWLLGTALVNGPIPAVAQQIRESRLASAIGQALPPPPDIIAQVGTYLDRHGFPQVFSGLNGGTIAPPVPPTTDEAVSAAAAAGSASTVQVASIGCGAVSTGSGFVTQPGFVVTNAHVIAGGAQITVRDQSGVHAAVPVYFDPDIDLAVLASPETTAPPISFVDVPVDRGIEGATLGYPGGQRTLEVKPATVRGRGQAVGRDIYGRSLVTREILTLSSPVVRGDSGGPFVTAGGEVGGVVFAAAAAQPGTGYAITAEQASSAVNQATATNQAVPTGGCRF